MLSKINNKKLDSIECNHCHKKHTDNGKFAYIEHKIHLCLYCGHKFIVKNANISNELDEILNVKDIKLDDNTLKIDNKLKIEYDILNGIVLVNNRNINKIIVADKSIELIEFLNKRLENLY